MINYVDAPTSRATSLLKSERPAQANTTSVKRSTSTPFSVAGSDESSDGEVNAGRCAIVC
jgi:hypothetical protein